jgi:NADPH:quinone reductase-like Zn-dependent oxidoreductase
MDYKIGDRVLTLSDQGIGGLGSYAEFVCASATRSAHLPDRISFAEAATIPVAGATAYGALFDLGGVRAGQVVFINGGAGGVGVFAIQMAKAAGARIATTCSPGNSNFLLGLGAERVINYNAENVTAALSSWAPAGLDLIVDAVGLGSLPPETPDVVKLGGAIICIATLIKDIEGFDLERAAARDVRVIPNLIAIARQPEHFRGALDAVSRGEINVPPYEIMALEDAATAHRMIEASHVRGKILLRIADL